MNDINELRAVLFETLNALKDKENPMPIDRAKAIGEIAQVVINSAKVEVDHMRVSKSSGTGFLGLPAVDGHGSRTVMTQSGEKIVDRRDGFSVTTHRMR